MRLLVRDLCAVGGCLGAHFARRCSITGSPTRLCCLASPCQPGLALSPVPNPHPPDSRPEAAGEDRGSELDADRNDLDYAAHKAARQERMVEPGMAHNAERGRSRPHRATCSVRFTCGARGQLRGAPEIGISSVVRRMISVSIDGGADQLLRPTLCGHAPAMQGAHRPAHKRV